MQARALATVKLLVLHAQGGTTVEVWLAPEEVWLALGKSPALSIHSIQARCAYSIVVCACSHTDTKVETEGLGARRRQPLKPGPMCLTVDIMQARQWTKSHTTCRQQTRAPMTPRWCHGAGAKLYSGITTWCHSS